MREVRIACRGWGAVGLILLAVGCTGAETGSAARMFEVAYVSPPDGFVLEEQPAAIQFHFTRPIDPASVSDRSIRLVCEDGMEVRGERKVTLLTPATVTFEPAEPLHRGKEYFAVASTDIRDATGRPLAAPYSSVLTLASPRSGTPSPGPVGGSPGGCAEPVGRTVFGARNGRLGAVDSLNGSEPFVPAALAPSTRLHDCRRWYLEWAASSLTTPDGEPALGIRARSSEGQVVNLLPANANRGMDANDFPVRWGANDSFFSFIAIDWAGGTATSYIVRIPLSWEDGEPAADLAGEKRLAPSSVLGPGDSAIHVFDWSPSGDHVVFSRWLAVNKRYDIYVHEVASAATSLLVTGDWPAWSPVGPDDAAPIVYTDYVGNYPGVYTIGLDGSDKTRVSPTFSPTGGNFTRESPVWSADGLRLAVTRTEHDLAPGATRTWAVEVMHLGLETIEEISGERFDFLLGWR
ncbi:MAG: Ig-like domain-containing protein [Planctomycetota bacterium]|jgi:hypothetical protein